jgi:hypothetical protein
MSFEIAKGSLSNIDVIISLLYPFLFCTNFLQLCFYLDHLCKQIVPFNHRHVICSHKFLTGTNSLISSSLSLPFNLVKSLSIHEPAEFSHSPQSSDVHAWVT